MRATGGRMLMTSTAPQRVPFLAHSSWHHNQLTFKYPSTSNNLILLPEIVALMGMTLLLLVTAAARLLNDIVHYLKEDNHWH